MYVVNSLLRLLGRWLKNKMDPEFPESWQAYEGLGETYLKQGDTEQAIQSFKKSVELNPQNTKAIEMLKKLEEK